MTRTEQNTLDNVVQGLVLLSAQYQGLAENVVIMAQAFEDLTRAITAATHAGAHAAGESHDSTGEPDAVPGG